MLDRDIYSAENCSLARTLAIVGEKWTMLILRESINGATRFQEFQAVLGCPRNLLASRLDTLVQQRIFERVAYQEPRHRTRHRYVLTGKGAALLPGLIALTHWGDQYLADPDGPATIIRHRGCGGELRTSLQCGDHDHEVDPRDVDLEPGPGALKLKDTA